MQSYATRGHNLAKQVRVKLTATEDKLYLIY